MGLIPFDAAPDYPVDFGYKCQWYAIKSADKEAVASAFKLSGMQQANWQTGIAGAYSGYYFVTPPVDGWVLVINSLMPDLSVEGEGNPLETVLRLSRQFGEACYFGTHRVVDYHAWAKAVQGELIRAYSYVGESDEVIADEGEPTEEEKDNDLIFAGFNDDEGFVPGEDDVITIAELWTVSPFMQEAASEQGVGVGIVGKLKPDRGGA